MPFYYVARQSGRGVYVRALDEEDALEAVGEVAASASFVRRCGRPSGREAERIEALAASQGAAEIDPGEWVGDTGFAGKGTQR